MEMQVKQDHFSIRKLSIGAASVLLGFTFFGMGSQSVQADTVTPASQIKDAANQPASTESAANNESVDKAKQIVTAPKADDDSQTKKVDNDKKEQKLDTYEKLSKFLRDGVAVAVSDGSVAEPSTPTSSTEPVAKPDQKPTTPTGTNTASDITANNGTTVPANTNKPTDDKLPADADIASATAKPNQKPVTTDPVTGSATITNGDKPTAPEQDDKKKPATQDEVTSQKPTDGLGFDKTTDAIVYVANWDDFVDSIGNVNVHNIEIIHDFSAPETGELYVGTPERQLTIESSNKFSNMPKGGFNLDFRNFSPRMAIPSWYTSNITKIYRQAGSYDKGTKGSLDVTYNNLRLFGESYFGLFNTYDNMDGDGARVTLKDVTYTGSQTLYTGAFTEVHIQGNVTVDSVGSYISPIDGAICKTQGGDGQQVFELQRTGDTITFDKDSVFTGSSSDGNVIELHSGDNGTTNVVVNGQTKTLSNRDVINIESGATVTLNPRKNEHRSDIYNAQNTYKSAAINVYTGSGDINIATGGILNINVAPASGGFNNGKTTAILMKPDDDNATVDANINVSGTINVTTNGNISDWGNMHTDPSFKKDDNVLVYDGGNLKVNPGGALNIIGTNMRTYSGTLLYIGGKADLENGTLDVELQNDPNYPDDPNYGAGTGKIILVDVASTDALKVNNPQKLVLNASLNNADGTSIIGNNEIDITNVRQVFDFSDKFPNMSPIMLPAFHVLKIKKTDSGISVIPNGIEVLNGKQSLSRDVLSTIASDLKEKPELANILIQAFGVSDANTLFDTLQNVATSKVSFDTIFENVIEKAFTSKGNIGYNNITMVPANSGGFLNIQDDNGNVGKPSYHQNDDGSLTVSGKVTGYNKDVDGYDQPNNLFSKLMHCGTDIYIAVKIGNSTEYYKPTKPIEDPYVDTNDGQKGVTNDLPHTYVAKADPDTGVFLFTLPAGVYQKGDVINVVPEANFISYDPKDPADSHSTGLNDGIADPAGKQKDAVNAINTAANNAKEAIDAAAKADPNQTPEHQQKYTDYKQAVDDAVNAATAKPTLDNGQPNPNYDADKSFYGSDDFGKINTAKTNALNLISAAQNKAQAYSDIQQYIAKAKDDLNKAGVDTADFAGEGSGLTDADIDNALDSMIADGSNKDTVVNGVKQTAFNKYEEKIPTAITDYDGTKGTELSGLTLPTGSTYQSDIDNSKNNVANGLTFKGDGNEFTGSTNITNAKKAIDLTVAKANAASELQKYTNSMTNAHTNCMAAINAANNDMQAAISGESNIANLQDSTHANANADNHDSVTDVKNGIDAINNAIAGYKDGLKSHLNAQINGGTDKNGNTYESLTNKVSDLKGNLDGAGIGTDTDIVQGINALNKELNDAAAIAKDGGAIDTAKNDTDAATKNKQAQALIDDATKRLAALNKLKSAADQAKQTHPEQAPAINNAWKQAVKDVLNAAKDTDKNTDKNGNGPIEAAADNGGNIINNAVLHDDAEKAIYQAYQAAKTRVKNSNLSTSQQDKYNQALDQEYKNATDKTNANSKDSIFATNNTNYINNRKQRALNKFNMEATQAEVAGYANQIKNDLGITDDNKNIDYGLNLGEGLFNKIPETSADNSKVIASNEQAAKEIILTFAKQAAQDLLAQKEKAVEDAFDKLATLTGNNLTTAKKRAKDIIKAADEKINAAQDKEGVRNAYNDGIANLNNLLASETNKDKRSQAVQAIKDERDRVLAALDKSKGKYPDLTDDHRQQLINDANNAADAGIDALATANDSEVEDDKNKASTNIDNVLTNAASEDKSDKENKENEVQKAKVDALDKLKEAYDAATSKVNGYKDTQVSSSDKSKIIGQLTADYQAAQAAINTATNTADVNTAEHNGENQLNQDAVQADLEAAKSDAITELDTARDNDLQVVETAHTNHLITDEQCTDMKDEINSFHDAGTSAINKDMTKDQVDQDKETVINEMQGVVDGISNTTLSNSKNAALSALEAAADKAKKHIDDLTSLGSDEKNTLKGKVDQALGDAEIAVNTATTPNDVTSIEANAKTEFANISAAADLKNAKNAGKHQLDDKQTAVDNAIDELNNLDTQSKEALKQSIKEAYDAALGKVNNPNPATPVQVGSNAQAGCDAMQDILGKAQGLDTVKDQDKAKLDQAAQEAKDRIKQTSLTDNQKQAAYTAIETARDQAKADVDKATDTPSANKVEKDGEAAIVAAEAVANKNYLDGLKDQANKDIDAACDDAEKDLANEWATLTPAEQAEAKPAFDKANADIESVRKDSKQKITDAKNKKGIDDAVATAQTAAAAEKPALLASAKAKGKQAIKDYGNKVKGQLTNQTDKDTVDSLVTAAESEIDNDDQLPIDIDNTVNKYKQKIDGVKNTADSIAAGKINTAKQDAVIALNNKLNGDGKGNKGVLNQIDDLKNDLTQDQLAQYKDQASKAHDDAVTNVKGDSDIAQINDDRDTGISGMQAALDAASLQAAKNNADKKLEQDAQGAIDKINGMTNLTDKQKQDAIDKVNNAISTKPDGGQYEINQATDQSKIPDIVTNTENAINTITDNASNTAYTAAQKTAKDHLKDKADKLKQKIKDDLVAGKLSETQANGTDGKGGLNAEVDNALSTAEGKINTATDQTGIDNAESNGMLALNTVSDDINKDEAQKADLDKVAAAANAAKTDADKLLAEHPNMTSKQKQSVYDLINSINNAANNSINKDRQNPKNTIDKMNTDANEAVNQLTNLTNGWDIKEKAVEKLKAHAKTDRDNVTNTNPDFDQLTPVEIAAAKEAIHTAQRAGEDTIFGLDPNKDDLAKVEQGCETDVDNALLPYKLLNNQHRQTTILNDYADGQSGDDAINAMPNLTAQEKDDYKQQIETARQKAAKNINGVKLPDKPTSDDYTTAAKEVDDAEKAGEDAIAAIINKAKLSDDKRQADKDLEDAANNAKKDNPTLADDINKIVSDAEKQIADTTVSDPTNPDSSKGIKDNAVDKINKLVDSAKVNNHKENATKKLDQEKADADKIIDRSQLTDDQKVAAHKKLQDLYDEAQKRLEDNKKDKAGQSLSAAAYEKETEQIANDYQKMIDRVIKQNQENTTYPWFDNEVDNAHGDLSDKWNSFKDGLSDAQKDTYKDLIDTVNNSIKQLDKSQDGHKTSIADATQTYDDGLTVLNKLKAIKDVEDAEAAANDAINNSSNLTDDQKKPYKNDVYSDATNAINNILGVTPSANDTIGNQDTIDKAKNDGIDDMNTHVNNAKNDDAGKLADAKTSAAAKIDAAYNSAKTKLGDAYKQGGELDQVHQHELDQLNGLSLDALQNIDDAIKNVDKAAVNEAGTYAKGQIDNLTNFTDHQKEALKGQIDRDVAHATGDKGTITTGTTDPDTVTDARDKAIDTILADAKGDTQNDKDALNNDIAVQKERSKAKLDSDYHKAIQELHDKFGKDANTSKVDAANDAAQKAIDDPKNTTVEDVQKAETAGEKEISKSVVEDAQMAAGKLIQNIKHKDNKPYTAHEQQALTNAIQNLVNKTNGKDGQQGSLDTTNDVDKTRQDAMKDILETVTDGTDKNKAVLKGDKAVQLDEAKKAAKDKLQQAYNTVIDNGVTKEDAGPVQTAANTAIDNATDQDGINAAELAGEKALAKLEVQTAANKAKQAVDKLTNHKDGTPYTAAEKQAIKDAIQKEVDKADGTKDNQGTIDAANTAADVDTAKKTAINAINQIKDDCDNNDEAAINAIINHDSKVEQERRDKQNAQTAVQAAADKARQDLGVEKGSDKAKKIDKAEQDALDAINQVTNGKYKTAENSGLANVVEAEKNTAKDQLGNSADTTAIDAITSADTTSANVTDKQSAIKTAFDSSKDKQAAITTANNAISAAHQAAVDQLHHQYGSNADTSNTDAAFNNHHVAQGDTVEAINADALEVEKEIAKGDVADAAANAKDKIDHLTNKLNGTPYTDAEKQALKDAIQHEVDQANEAGKGSIDQAQTNDDVTNAANEAIEAINKITDAGANNDNSVLEPIFDTNAGVSSERKNKAAAAAAISAAADKARQDLGVEKGSKAAAAIDQAEQAGLAGINQVSDGKYETAENTGLANVVEAEKTVSDDILASAESAAESAIDKTSGLSAGDKDKAKQAAQGQLTTTKNEVGKVSSDDVSSANVTDKQNAIKDAVNAGKNSINGTAGAASDLGAAKQQAKEKVSDAAASANKAVDQLANHQDGTPYTAAEKQALKDAIQAEVDKANGTSTNQGTIDKANTAAGVDTAKNNALNAINKFKDDSKNNDEDSLAPIVNGNSAVQKERQDKQTARDNVSAAADKARKDLGVAKGSKAAAAIDKAEQDALNAINQVTDGKYSDTENSGLGNIVEAEKNTVKEELGGNSAALDAISSSDTNPDNVTGKQNAIKDAYHAGKVAAAKQKAADKLKAAYDAAKQKLGANADFSALDRSYQLALNNLQGESDDELNKSEFAGERLIGKGAVQSAYDTAAKKIEQMWPDDNLQTAKDKKNALLEAAQGLLDEANEVDNGTIDQAQHSTGVSDARNDAIDKIKGIHSDKDTINNIVDNDKVVQIDKAHDTAVASGVDQNEVQQIRDNTAKQIKHDLQTGDKEAAKEHELAGEKEIAKLTVQGAATNAKDKIDHLTNKPNGTPYTDAEKQALKDKVDKEIDDYVTQGDQAITASDTTDKVNKAKDEVINNINDAISDSHLADILSKDPNVAKNDAENAIDNAVVEANEAIDSNKNWSKEQKDKLKDKVKQDAQAGKDKIEHDFDINTINQDRDNTVSQIKNDYTDQATINTIVGNSINNSSSSNTEPVQHSDEGEKDLILMHNAYLYDENGERANMVDLKAGSVVETYGKEKIGDKDYFVLIDHGANDKKYYVVCTNINSVHTTLKHNAYVYDEYGQRIKSRHAIKAGTNIATFGDAVTIRGIKYYIIGENKFVRATNVSETEAADTKTVTKTAKVEATVGPISDKPDAPVQKKIMHNAYAYNDKGVRANGLIFSAGTVIPTTGAKSIDGVLYYELDDGMYIKAANIDAKKLRLQHNAYIYSQYGNREGKRVLKKHKLVKTYGDPISIHGKKYYITAKGKFVKKANFNKK
ncbi:SLAP domain-containing protein [Lactobacillus sp. ESL0703]|uniref:SLAP domain-containing protein n=1 Tax=Lactobacillus sp. ESL0703 TaxID=2983218 RepID=UPI0023F7A4DC|nr:SLAP domain-containing protein [Lactobacillus sp. ESL0703]MDF7668460.1 SLAP domain-containing protein [Lactobacillus sp. ESL0703]